MRKLTATLLLLMLLLSSSIAFAADVLYRMLHADEVEAFQKDQDALLVGKLISSQDNTYTVKVLKVLSGAVQADTIQVSSNFYYGWGQTLPRVNDFSVLSVKRSGDLYNKAWGIFKADSGNYQTLKLVPENAQLPGLSADLACIQWYVNSGGRENDFSFSTGTAFVKRPDGQVLQIYPPAGGQEQPGASAASLTERADRQTTQYAAQNQIIFSVVLAFSVITILAVYLKRRKKMRTDGS